VARSLPSLLPALLTLGGWLAEQDHPAYIPRLLSAVTGRAGGRWFARPAARCPGGSGRQTGMLIRRSDLVGKG
jgi:hypothetical protein